MAALPQPVLVIMGVSGSGKSTVAEALVERLGWAFEEGDELHPPSNVAKLSAGVALTDEDRAPWLHAVAAWIDKQITAGEPGIVTCSALRRRYRDVLRRPDVVFVYLEGPADLIGDRLEERRGHFMSPSLLGSQVSTLEPPEADERSVAVDITRPLVEQIDAIVAAVAPTDRAT